MTRDERARKLVLALNQSVRVIAMQEFSRDILLALIDRLDIVLKEPPDAA